MKKILLSVWTVLRTSSAVADLFVSLRKSSTIFGSLGKSEINCCQMTKNSSYTKQNNIVLFRAVFASFWNKFTFSNNFLLLVQMPKIELFHVTKPKTEGISVLEYLLEYCTKRLLLHQLTASLIRLVRCFL